MDKREAAIELAVYALEIDLDYDARVALEKKMRETGHREVVEALGVTLYFYSDVWMETSIKTGYHVPVNGFIVESNKGFRMQQGTFDPAYEMFNYHKRQLLTKLALEVLGVDEPPFGEP